ncbi:MAG TPA: hypothetical protein DDZ51_29260 [Planctomycetaceae bacterium]|nr:hypothetical protein [Planctomycetaceae bacterium]
MINRREFLQCSSAIGISCIDPPVAVPPAANYHLIQTDTLNSWSVADPIEWSLQNADQPILARAADRLGKLTNEDNERIVRLVVRRCGLNLVDIQSNQVTVHYWSDQLADLRPFFKASGLASPDVQVTLINRKTEVFAHKIGDEFRYGERLAEDFSVELLTSKWHHRFVNQPDDQQAVPGSRAGFAWEGLEDGQIPWAAMKSAWRRMQPIICLNCDQPNILVNFGLPQVSFFRHAPRFISVCPKCQRSFVDDSITDVTGWMATNLDQGVRPGFRVVFGNRVERLASS